MKKIAGYVIAVLLGCVGCQKMAFGPCGGYSGATVEQRCELPLPFAAIRFGDDMDIFLIYDEQDYILTRMPDYVDFHTGYTGDTLSLGTSYSCPFFSDRKPCHVEVHHSGHIKSIIAEGDAKVTSLDTLRGSHLVLFTQGNSAAFDLTVNLTTLYLYAKDTTPLRIQGKCSHFVCYTGKDFNTVDASALKADKTEVSHEGYCDVQVYPVKSLWAKVYSTGNVIYHHEPTTLKKEEYYRGRVVPK